MDEPTDGLDPNQKHHVRALLGDMAKDKAIIISTHILEEVDAVCSRAMIIAHGKLLAFPRADADILDPVCRAVERAGLAVNEVYVERGRLDEVFRQLTYAA